MTTESEALARVLRAAVSNVDTPADFAETALRKGKRRKQRVRASMVAAALAVTAMLGGALSGVSSWRAESERLAPASDTRLSRPTAGDLAGDAAFLSQARTTWDRELDSHLRLNAAFRRPHCPDFVGQPHVYWAGKTSGGPAAVIMQLLRQTASCSILGPPNRRVLVGLVGIDAVDGEQHLLGLDGVDSGIFVFGPHNATVIALQESQAHFISPRAEHEADGTVVRRWSELVYRDGLAVTTVTVPGPSHDHMAVFTKHKPTDLGATLSSQDRLRVKETGPDRALITRRGYDWRSPGLRWTTVRGDLSGTSPTSGDRMRRFADALDRFRLTDPAYRGGYSSTFVGGPNPSSWHITAVLPDGRSVIVGEGTVGYSSWSCAVLFRGDKAERVVRGSKIDRGATLPVMVRLPDGQGWVVAQQGAALKWSTAGGAWNPVPGDAALIPDAAATVEVTLPGKAAVTVPLPR